MDWEKRHSQITATWIYSAYDNKPEKATGDVSSEMRKNREKKKEEEGEG